MWRVWSKKAFQCAWEKPSTARFGYRESRIMTRSASQAISTQLATPASLKLLLRHAHDSVTHASLTMCAESLVGAARCGGATLGPTNSIKCRETSARCLRITIAHGKTNTPDSAMIAGGAFTSLGRVRGLAASGVMDTLAAQTYLKGDDR